MIMSRPNRESAFRDLLTKIMNHEWRLERCVIMDTGDLLDGHEIVNKPISSD